MKTTVYFATNRALTGPPEAPGSYGRGIVSPDPTAVTYGTAFVDGIDIASNTQGTISLIQDTNKGGFSQQAIGDLSDPGRNLLVFIHGFDNTFADAITRAAFNREWLAASGVAAADATVIAFSWPSAGQLVSFPILQADYVHDQMMATHSAIHLMSFFANLEPILRTALAGGRFTTLLAHSMGNLALQAAVESWFLHGNGNAALFQEAVLAAADCGFNAFDPPPLARLSGLRDLAHHISVYFSQADQVLQLSMVVNLGAQRLGQDGPRDKSDPARFPPTQFRMVDCTQIRDFDYNFLTSHQYYRLSSQVRADIAASMGAQAAARTPVA